MVDLTTTEVDRLRLERDLYLGLLGLSEREDPGAFVEEALGLIVRVLGAEQGYLEVSDPEEGPTSWRAAGCSDEQVELIRSIVSRGIIAEAMAIGEVIACPSAILDPRFRDRPSVQASRIEAVLCVPIVRKAPIGVLYIQGRRALVLDEDVRKKLRLFVLNGGYIWADACTGSNTFADAFRAEMKQIFPDRPLAVLPPDHPVFRASSEVLHVKYSPACNRVDDTPVLEGIYVGCRTAVFLFPYDMSCAWDSFHVPQGGRCIVGEDAMKLGVNLCAYSISYYNLGRFLSMRKTLDTDDDMLKGDFVFAQVKTNGLWDPHPSAFANVLKTTLAATNTKVNFGRKEVPLTDPNLLSYPFLYLTGHGEFTLDEVETSNLKRFLSNGGFLLADACCGNLEFDRAFRREIKKVLPDAELKPLVKEHPVFSTLHKLDTVEYSAQVRATLKDINAPMLEGLNVGEDTRVIYSRFGLGSGWDGQERPYAYEVLPNDALKMGVNIILYSMTH